MTAEREVLVSNPKSSKVSLGFFEMVPKFLIGATRIVLGVNITIIFIKTGSLQILD